jgi:hypothetical protein
MSSFSSENTSSINLISLIRELQLEIVEKLSYRDKARLRATNHYFQNLIPTFTHDDLLAAEREEWATSQNLLTCRDCMQLRHKSAFGDAMRRRRKGRNGTRRYDRFCINCGLHPPLRQSRYSAGTSVEVDGKRFVVCGMCWRLKIDWHQASGQCIECYRLEEKKLQELHERNAQTMREFKLRRLATGGATVTSVGVGVIRRRRPISSISTQFAAEQDISGPITLEKGADSSSG